MKLRSTSAAALAIAVAVLPACADPGDAEGERSRTEIRVLAAASLTDVLGAVAPVFEREHEAIDVVLSFGASSALAQQAAEGIDADVLVTADEQTMDAARAAGAIAGQPVVIARNRLAMLVEQGNPRGIDSVDDLEQPDLVVVLCAPEVPCGALARAFLDDSGVRVTPASLEENVRGVVSKVTLGEADAGIVYETDARITDGEADTIAMAGAADRRFEAVYPAAVLEASSNRDAAEAFVGFLTSDAAQSALREAGFRAP